MTLNTGNMQDMRETITRLIEGHKGILAIDERIPTIGKRLESVGISDNSFEQRMNYRNTLLNTLDLSKYISGAILFEETLDAIGLELADKGILAGIKADKGLAPLSKGVQEQGGSTEQVTQGLDDLGERLVKYKQQGASFAKWRAVFRIGDNTPSHACINENVQRLTQYASICQQAGIVPIVEPEVLMEGAHDLVKCYNVTMQVLCTLFECLQRMSVSASYMLLKTSMVLQGTDCTKTYSDEEIALSTLLCLSSAVHPLLPGVVFLSGGQSTIDATNRLKAINLCKAAASHSWKLSFSYGRALQTDAMKKWANGDHSGAQNVLLETAKANAMAVALRQ